MPPQLRPIHPFEGLRESAMKGSPRRSVRWYQDKLRKLGMGLRTISPERVIQSGLGHGVSEGGFGIGNMCMFYYHAKHAARLPHWDAFPLVIPFRMNLDGFHGVNFHYLSPPERLVFLEDIMAIRSGRLNWPVLQARAKTFADHCVKQYLYTHVKNQYFLRIDKEDWKTAIMMPVERFQKQSKYTAYL